MRCQSQEVLIFSCLLKQLFLSTYIISVQRRAAVNRKDPSLIQNMCLGAPAGCTLLSGAMICRTFVFVIFLRRSTLTLPGFWGQAENDFTVLETCQFFSPGS